MVTKLEPEIFDGAIERLSLEILKAVDDIKKLEMREQALASRRRQMKADLQRKQSHLSSLKRAAVVARGIPQNLSALRERILVKKKKTARKDIRIDTKERLEGEIHSIIAKLQRLCPHAFVVGYNSYGGDRSYDYENRYPGFRKCVVCDFSEFATRGRYPAGHELGLECFDIFKALKDSDGRIFQYADRVMAHKILDVWQPIDDILAKFQSAEDML